MTNISRAISTTFKQIRRSGWLALASVSVMSLAFLISSIFSVLAYTSNLFLKSVEQEPQIYAFFEIGTNEDTILDIKQQWEGIEGVAYVDYTSEAQAKEEFYAAQRDFNELAAEAVKDRNLPASLAIRLYSLEDADKVNRIILNTQKERPEVKTILYSSEIVNNIREVFLWLRIGGGTIMLMLIIVLILFTLLTIEFRMHSRAEEIGIMQLVGGSLFYIRLPFIIEGALYGIIGAIISNLFMSAMFGVLQYQIRNNDLIYIKELVGRLDWPELSVPTVLALLLAPLLIGALLGGLNSYIAIRRYIK